MSRSTAARLAYAALFASVGASFPYLPLWYASLGFGLDMVGLLAALAAAAGLLAAPLWGALADRFSGSRLVLPAAAALAALGALGLAFARGPILVPLAAAAIALTFAGLAPILDARALETVRGDRNRYGRLRAWGSGAFIVVVWLTGALIERAGIASMFVLYVPALAVLALVTLAIPGQASMTPALPRLTGIGLVLRQPRLTRFLLAALLAWSASMAINGYFSIHLEAIGAPGELVGAAWALGAAVEIPIMWAYPALAARVGSERLIVAGAGALFIRAVAVALVADPLFLTLTMVLHGIGFALLLVGGVTYVSRLAPPSAAATAQGVLSATVFSLAMIIGPGMAGLGAAGLGLPATFAIASVASLGGVLALALVVARRPVPAAVPSDGYHRSSG